MRSKVAAVAAVAIMAGAFLAHAVLAAGSGPPYLHVSSFSASAQNGNLAKLSVTTEGTIPRQPDSFILSHLVVGYAWADLEAGKVFVVVIHPSFRDSRQKPDSWHAHTATLAGGATSPNDFCVASIDSAPTAGIQIHGDAMDVNVRSDALPVDASRFDAAVGFTLEQDPACATGLAVRVVT